MFSCNIYKRDTLFNKNSMKKIFMAIIALAMISVVTSCKKINGKGDVVREVRNIYGFTGVSLSVDANTYIRQDTFYKVEILAQQNVLDVIESPLEGGTLVIKLKDHTILGKHDPITVYITSPELNSLNISGSGNIEGNTCLSGVSLNLVISGSGNIRLPGIQMKDIQSNISGSGNISIVEGNVSKEDLNISGSGSIDLLGIVSDTVYARISGSGNIRVTSERFLDGTISGSGNVYYMGSPVVNAHISGSGAIIHL